MFRIFNDHTCKNSSWLFIVFFVDYFCFFRYAAYDSKVCFLKLDGGGWVVVCVCVRACVRGGGGGVGGEGAVAPRRGWCRRSTKHSFLKTRFCLRFC